MLVTRNWIASNYRKFNHELWGGKLPEVTYHVSRARHAWGVAYYKFDWANSTIIPDKISISNYYDSPENVKIQTLLHEMIHIADYTFHPEHYIKNGRRVSGHSYDAHGYWFKKEAERISKITGYTITNKVTKEESIVSTPSEHAMRCKTNKINNALLCVVTGDNGTIFYFKTDIHKINIIKKNLKLIRWYKFNKIKTVKYYTFNDPKFAELRSCGKQLLGWYIDKPGLNNMLKKMDTTEVKF